MFFSRRSHAAVEIDNLFYEHLAVSRSSGIVFGHFRTYFRTTVNFMAEWLRAWDTLAMMKLWRREVVSSIPDRGTIVG